MPTFLLARERVLLSRIPVFDAPSTGPQTPKNAQRSLPRVSVFQATECRFNDDFTQLALKVSSSFSMTGWINVDFYDMLMEVDDPRAPLPAQPTMYMQNVARRTGKWMGELPVRAIPSLQAPRRGRNLACFQIVCAFERKLVKDQVWIRIQEPMSENGNGDVPPELDSNEESKDDSESSTEAWIVERNANSGEPVMAPWGSGAPTSRASDTQDRFYRNVFARRGLPIRSQPNRQADTIGELEPGAVVPSSLRVLSEDGRMWICIKLAAAPLTDSNEPPAVVDGFVAYAHFKTNKILLQEIELPGKLSQPQVFQVIRPRKLTSELDEEDANDEKEQEYNLALAARAEPNKNSREVFRVRNGAFVKVVGSVYNRVQQQMWLQVMAEDLDSSMKIAIKGPHQQPLTAPAGSYDTPMIVFLPVCDPHDRPYETEVHHVGRPLTKITNPNKEPFASEKTSLSARVIFSGRASKLFGSSLLRLSTASSIDFSKSSPVSPPAAAAGESPSDSATSVAEEVRSWQQQLGSQSSSTALWLWTAFVLPTAESFTVCVQRPFSSCLQKEKARTMYAQLDQDEEHGELFI